MAGYVETRRKLDDALDFVDDLDGPEAKRIERAIAELDAAERAEAAGEIVAATDGIGHAVSTLRALLAEIGADRAARSRRRLRGAVAEAMERLEPRTEEVAHRLSGEPAPVTAADPAGHDAPPEEAEADSPAARVAPSSTQERRTPDEMIADILAREGGFVNHPADRGGPTKLGVTQSTLAAWRGHAVSEADVRDLAVDEARAIFRARYFDEPEIDRLPELIQPVLFDMSVNHGPGGAVRLLQRALTENGFECAVDGGIGEQTVGCATEASEQLGEGLINAVVDERVAFYRRIVERDPSQSVFLKGWLRRAEGFRVG